MSDIDPSINLSDALSELIAFDAQGRAIWPAKELAAMLSDHPQIRLARELLEEPNPALEPLIALKDSAKRRTRESFPPEVALLIYYGSIAAAMVRCGRRITRLRDDDLRHGFMWAIQQPWVPQSISDLFRQAISKLSSGPRWRE